MTLGDFEPAQFRGLTLEEQIAKCHAMAAEAESFAAVSHGDQDKYLDLAAKWSDLAEEMERALIARQADT